MSPGLCTRAPSTSTRTSGPARTAIVCVPGAIAKVSGVTPASAAAG
jgi:hypothetical protein